MLQLVFFNLRYERGIAMPYPRFLGPATSEEPADVRFTLFATTPELIQTLLLPSKPPMDPPPLSCRTFRVVSSRMPCAAGIHALCTLGRAGVVAGCVREQRPRREGVSGLPRGHAMVSYNTVAN